MFGINKEKIAVRKTKKAGPCISTGKIFGLTESQQEILSRITPTSKPILNTSILQQNNKFIDLRKHKDMSESQHNDIVPTIQPQPQTQQETVKNKFDKQIVITINLTGVTISDNQFLEKLKLQLISDINEVIIDTETHTKNSSGYTINKVKLETEINCN